MRDQSGRPGQAAGPARASSPPSPGTGVAARGQRWARLRRSLWQPPRPHGDQPRERVVGPLELFYDLAVVVLVAQAAHRLAGHLTWRGLGEFTVVFTLVWIAWANGSLHHELHGHDDARARSTFLLQILVLAAMGAFIPQAGGARGAAFAVTAAVLFAVLAVLWLPAARGDRPEYRRASPLFVTGTAACAVLLAVTAVLRQRHRSVRAGGGVHPRLRLRRRRSRPVRVHSGAHRHQARRDFRDAGADHQHRGRDGRDQRRPEPHPDAAGTAGSRTGSTRSRSSASRSSRSSARSWAPSGAATSRCGS